MKDRITHQAELAPPTFPSTPYRDWERYQDLALPPETVIAIGNEIAQDITYPGFSEVGKIIVDTQRNPDKFKSVFPQLAPPINVRFTNTVKEDRALANIDHDIKGIAVVARTRNKKTREVSTGVFADIDRVALTIKMDNSSSQAPDLAKRFLLVKEFSHFVYYQQHKEEMLKQIFENFDILEPADMDTTFLYENGVFRIGSNVPRLGELFENGLIDIDGAGYWHTTQAFGKMKRLGHLPQSAIHVLSSNDKVFETALVRGLLLDQGKGKFTWKNGVGPFNPEWTSITRAVLTGKSP